MRSASPCLAGGQTATATSTANNNRLLYSATSLTSAPLGTICFCFYSSVCCCYFCPGTYWPAFTVCVCLPKCVSHLTGKKDKMDHFWSVTPLRRRELQKRQKQRQQQQRHPSHDSNDDRSAKEGNATWPADAYHYYETIWLIVSDGRHIASYYVDNKSKLGGGGPR